jgi:PAS domain S-box-containing protein
MLNHMSAKAEVPPPEASELSVLRAELEIMRARERALESELARMRRSEEHYRSLVEQAQDGFFLADRQGIYRGSNAALRQMLGYTEAELQGKHITDMIDPLDLARTPLRRSELKKQPRLAASRRLRRKDGSTVYTEIVASVLPDGSFEAIVRDVSDRLRADAERAKLLDELRHAQKMESIGRLAGGIAHDFNNLLLVISAHAHVLRRRYGPLIASELDGIVTAAERGGALTRQLLSFSRKRTLKPTIVDLNDVARGMQGMLERLMGDSITLDFRLDAAPCRLLADAGQLEQVVMNLAVNARAACANGGRVSIETELAPAAGRCDGPRAGSRADVWLRVRDNGHGMDAATQARIFEPFFTTKGPSEGTGLGLSMVYGIVTQSGGSISVQSLPGLGCVFELRFAAIADDKPAQVDATASEQGSSP